jgi:hypothetical protein
MSLKPHVCVVASIALPALICGGCADVVGLLPGLNTVQVELINDTSFPVDANIRFDDDSGFWASLAPADSLDAGLIEPGEIASFTFDCDELGLILSDEAEQVVSFFDVFVADSTDILERDEEYDCGDVVRFRFVGDTYDFGVIVSVNGRIVD